VGARWRPNRELIGHGAAGRRPRGVALAWRLRRPPLSAGCWPVGGLRARRRPRLAVGL